MARATKVLDSSMTLLNILVLMVAYLFPCKIGTNVCVKILGNKKLSTLVECPNYFFPRDQHLYRREVSLEVVFQILQSITLNGMICLSIFDRGVPTYVCLVNATHGS
jgi:hypothetical protein